VTVASVSARVDRFLAEVQAYPAGPFRDGAVDAIYAVLEILDEEEDVSDVTP
jgi:hypothetical protein